MGTGCMRASAVSLLRRFNRVSYRHICLYGIWGVTCGDKHTNLSIIWHILDVGGYLPASTHACDCVCLLAIYVDAMLYQTIMMHLFWSPSRYHCHSVYAREARETQARVCVELALRETNGPGGRCARGGGMVTVCVMCVCVRASGPLHLVHLNCLDF